MISLEQCRAAVKLQIPDDQLLNLRDMIYETVYGFLGAVRCRANTFCEKTR
jgi:hypothetical protein